MFTFSALISSSFLLLNMSLQLQFVEIKDDDRHIETLTADLMTIGHVGDVKPKLCNGRISRRHAVVVKQDNGWFVTDGVNGQPSTNGLRLANGERVACKLLSEAGQRVYLLKADKLECYIEVIEVDKTSSALAGRSTLNFEAELSQLNGTIEQTINHVQSVEKVAHNNQRHIQDVESRLDTALDAIERVGKRPWVFLAGTVVLGVSVLSGIVLFGIYSNMDKFVDTYIDHRYQKTQQQQQSK